MHLNNAITNPYRAEIRNSSPKHKHSKTKFTHTHTHSHTQNRTSNTQILRWVRSDQMGKNWVITKKSKHRGKKLGTTIPTQYSVRITLQSHQLRQSTPFYRQTLISATYCRLHTLRYIEYAYWRQLRPDVFSNESNRCDDGCWSQDIYSNEPQPFDEFWLTWSWW